MTAEWEATVPKATAGLRDMSKCGFAASTLKSPFRRTCEGPLLLFSCPSGGFVSCALLLRGETMGIGPEYTLG